jgi:hypothetical protein
LVYNAAALVVGLALCGNHAMAVTRQAHLVYRWVFVLAQGYAEPMPNPNGVKSVVVGASCWLMAVAGVVSGSPWQNFWVTVSAVSFAADYAARDTAWAVLDRYTATAASLAVLPQASPWLVCVAAVAWVASRASQTTRQWLVAHTAWHVAAAAVVWSANAELKAI